MINSTEFKTNYPVSDSSAINYTISWNRNRAVIYNSESNPIWDINQVFKIYLQYKVFNEK